MYRDTIWLLIGDDYTHQGYPSDTPCRSGTTIVTLKDAQDHPDFQKDFKVHLSGGTWTSACFAKTQMVSGQLRIEADELPSAGELVEVLSDILNTDLVTGPLEAAGVKGLKHVWLRLFEAR